MSSSSVLEPLLGEPLLAAPVTPEPVEAAPTGAASSLLFAAGVEPTRHLRRLGSRPAAGGSGAVLGPVEVAGGAVVRIPVLDGGTGYVDPRVIVCGRGSGARAAAVVVDGVVTAITIEAGGRRYADATAQLVDGAIVVLVGDSISTDMPQHGIPGESFWFQLQRALQEQNPGRRLHFFNRAIGAQTWSTFNDLAHANHPAWYCNHAKPWLHYLAELQPDLVVVAFGMNDRQNFRPRHMAAAIAKLRAFARAPDIVLATPLMPSASSANPNMSSPASQAGRDFVAGFVRAYALANDHGLLDFHRRLRMVRDGIDVRQSVLRVPVGGERRPLPWQADAACADFYLAADFGPVDADFWAGRRIDVATAPQGVNAAAVLRIEDADGRVAVSVIDRHPQRDVESVGLRRRSDLATPRQGALVIEVWCQDVRTEVRVNGTRVLGEVVCRCGGLVAPALSSSAAAEATITFAAGDYLRCPAALTDLDLYGGADSPFLGNGMNHPSSIALRHVIAPVIHNSDWRATPVGVGGGANAAFVGVGEPVPQAHLHVTKRRSGVSTPPEADADHLLLEDADAAGVTLRTGPAGTARWVAASPADARRFVQSFDHAADAYSEAIGGAVQRRLSRSVDAHHVPVQLPSYSVAQLPLDIGAGSLAFCPDEADGAVLVFFDGAQWRRVTDRAVATAPLPSTAP
ncbi:MAG TPA: SGNH/GDSL hydrolase family protein [Methylibium sp.]|nr:SGNH/GDSL hydrolase family protein [Methylibium sp.]